MAEDDAVRPEQEQQQPGRESEMDPEPIYDDPSVEGSARLKDKVALITGGDSGIGRAVAVAYAKEGADVAVVYLEEGDDAEQTRKAVEGYQRRCLIIAGDVGDERFCHDAVAQCYEHFGKLDILVNNAAEQHVRDDLTEIHYQDLERVFRTNIFSMFYFVAAALPHLSSGSAIINTTSITAYQGNPGLIDYSATKGAILAYTRSLSQRLVKDGIRVNGVAPGPIWTPLIPASFPADKVAKFGEDKPMGRAGQPVEVAPCYVFLASRDSSYMTGQVLHPNGGVIVNG
jgi:NAD(P)-dependent dehydrogenase (short-subunit alcohol dehydrogenase family)